MLKIYGCPNTRTVRVTWMLEELGLEYQYHLVNMAKGESQSSQYLEINPAGKVPTLSHEGMVLTESVAILNYLSTLNPEAELIPETSQFRRAIYDQWCCFTIAELEQPLWTIAKNRFALPEDLRCSNVIPTAEWEFQKALALLSDKLGENPYILGEHFSAADILIAHTLFWGMAFKQEIKQDNLNEYIGRNAARPALSLARKREQSEQTD